MQNLRTKDPASLAFVAVLSLVGCAMVLVSTARSGLTLSTVSGDYFAATRSILSGGGYIEHDGSPYLYYPPLFPLILAFFGLFGLDPADVVRPLNAITFGATVFVVGRWLYRNISYYPLAIFSTLMVAFGWPLISAHILASSEPVLVLVVICCLFAMQRYLERGQSRLLYLSAILAMLATLTRYTGAALIPTGVLMLAVRPNAQVREKSRDVMVFSLVTIVPLFAWLARNYLEYSVLSPERGNSVVPVSESARSAASIVLQSLSTGVLPTGIDTLAAGLLLVALVAYVAYRYVDNRESFHHDTLPRLLPPLCFSVFYIAMIVASVSTTALDDLSNRYMVPVYIPSLLCVVVVADGLRNVTGRSWSRSVLTYGIATAFLLLSLNSVRSSVKNVRYYSTVGVGGYSASEWQNSGVIEYLKGTSLDGEIYSNESAAVYVLTGIHARLSPRNTYFHSSTPAQDDMTALRRSLDGHGYLYLAWFNNVQRDYLMGVDELGNMFLLEPLAVCADGTVYRVLPRGRRD